MIRARILAMSTAWLLISASLIAAEDLSRYRGFQLGMSLVAVAQQAGITPEARILHRRPALIQELMWQPPRALGAPPPGNSVRKVLFRFYNDQLFRMVVSYDRASTEGLTVEDMVAAVSATYGLATLPATPFMRSVSLVCVGCEATVTPWEDSRRALTLDYEDVIVGRWDDSRDSVHLVRSSYLSTFGLVVFSKQVDALAQAAASSALRLDEQEAPQREIERQQRQTEEDRAKQETARRANIGMFRP